jgi:3-oxoacyl-[acyl-carrier protein] reductase
MLNDKIALVTGGSRGIGKAITKHLAELGATVVFTYVSSDAAAQAFVEESSQNGLKIHAFKADGGSIAAAEQCISFLLEKFGRLDILVNNAGITKDGLILRMSENDFDSVINSNLKSVFNYTKFAIKQMASQRSGKIINISSVVGINGNPGQSNYCASKAGVIGFTKSIAKEIASRNVTVNAVAPGFIASDMTDKLNDKQKEAIISQIPLKRIGTAEEIAHAVAFLASDNANYITGQVLVVDGGMVM